jgi:hypothetical protein
VTNFLLLATGFLLGGIAFGIFALLLLVHRKPPSITMHARKPVDVPHRRQWRDAPERREEVIEPIYMYGVTGLEEQ